VRAPANGRTISPGGMRSAVGFPGSVHADRATPMVPTLCSAPSATATTSASGSPASAAAPALLSTKHVPASPRLRTRHVRACAHLQRALSARAKRALTAKPPPLPGKRQNAARGRRLWVQAPTSAARICCYTVGFRASGARQIVGRHRLGGGKSLQWTHFMVCAYLPAIPLGGGRAQSSPTTSSSTL